MNKIVNNRFISPMTQCDTCKKKLAAILCPECCKCYCEECNAFIHRADPNIGHKPEAIPKGVPVKATCLIHNYPLEYFSVDIKYLHCIKCKEIFCRVYKAVDIREIAQNNDTFSAQKVKKEFADTLERDTNIALDKKTEEVIESINSEEQKANEAVEQTFAEEHKKLDNKEIEIKDKYKQEREMLRIREEGDLAKLNEERRRLNKEKSGRLSEIVNKCNRAREELNGFKISIRELREYNKVLCSADAEKTRAKCSRLMELNIVSEMERQQRDVKKLLETDMRDLRIDWNTSRRKLSFTRHLFNGVPIIKNVSVEAVSWKEMKVSWETSGEKKGDVLEYAVAMRREGEKDWKNVKSGVKNKYYVVGGLADGTAYEVRVMCTKEDLKGEWSADAKGRTKKWECGWKECPNWVNEDRKYSLSKANIKIATKIKDGYSTIIGDSPIPLSKVSSWSVKILKSKKNDGSYIYVGVAPSDIKQNIDYNYNNGWYFDCGISKLRSGPPHNHGGKEYGPRKGGGRYVQTGDSVGVVMDTSICVLSFVLNGVNLGVAYRGIPLDKPLVPCVILGYQGDSIKIIF